MVKLTQETSIRKYKASYKTNYFTAMVLLLHFVQHTQRQLKGETNSTIELKISE